VNTTQVATRTNTTIHDITGGTRAGTNLFHSFGNFSVGDGHTANFLNTTVNGSLPSTSNILGRVTGGTVSNIFGTVQTENFGGANLYLINPAGVLFGPTAKVNVGGSFNASTADYLRMGNDTFYASPSKPTVLSIAPVTAFGFLGGNPGGTIVIQGSSLQTANGQTLTLVGRDLTSGSTTTPGIVISGGGVNSSGGRINLVSVGVSSDPANALVGGEVVVSGSGNEANLTPTAFSNLGSINVTNANVSVGDGGFAANPGSIYVRGSNLLLNNGSIIASTDSSTGAAKAIDIQLTGDLKIRDDARVLTDSQLFGVAGALLIQAKNISIDDQRTNSVSE
jgi:filamentous hemagglutinin family protein